ncbi:Arginyl tRNA synthetase N-terminal domain-containing protein [Cynara cardunculus var. scolymus]|uniref:Arginyl tRNA synthetase N-terminal domain-containing protein n=1 Tax=Cynara cardunculus var. scolymus TaxID=59895 RepID=A0A103X801_CYNCS|nr:Arginyl tRNA synthetase N-terminal domain-containing protein [Cynara cardunculus var. scolymus]
MGQILIINSIASHLSSSCSLIMISPYFLAPNRFHELDSTNSSFHQIDFSILSMIGGIGKVTEHILKDAIMKNLPTSDMIESTSIAGPGFVNVKLSRQWMAKYHALVLTIVAGTHDVTQDYDGGYLIIQYTDVVSKLDEALAINPAKHEALWCLGNAHTANAFLTLDHDEAKIQFEQAFQCFEKAVEEGWSVMESENIFLPDLPYVKGEHGSIYFQVKNDEDILQTLAYGDNLVVRNMVCGISSYCGSLGITNVVLL